MPKYNVTLRRDVEEVACITVEAESEDDAILAAKEKATGDNFQFLQADTPYFADIEEATDPA